MVARIGCRETIQPLNNLSCESVLGPHEVEYLPRSVRRRIGGVSEPSRFERSRGYKPSSRMSIACGGASIFCDFDG